jgi:peptide-methionine (R)-S-oxide reductase
MEKIKKSKEEWKKELTPEQYRVMVEHGTEAPFSGKYWRSFDTGIYHCAACGNPLFTSETKFDAGCGWPSFFEPVSKVAVDYKEDTSHGMKRTEVSCGKCGAHLGHVFSDLPRRVKEGAPQTPTGQRYCINSASLKLKENSKNNS